MPSLFMFAGRASLLTSGAMADDGDGRSLSCAIWQPVRMEPCTASDLAETVGLTVP